MYSRINLKEIDQTTTIVEKRQLDDALKNAQAALTEANTSLQTKRDEVEAESRRLESINRYPSPQTGQSYNPADRSSMFHPKMPAFLAELATLSLTGEVIGPLGLEHIRLRDGDASGLYKQALAKILEHALRTFIVTNNRDRARVSSLLTKYGLGYIHPVTLQQPCRRHKVPATPTQPPGLLSVRDCLIIERDDVFNYLIDKYHIEEIFLARDLAHARRSFTIIEGSCGRFTNDIIKKLILASGETLQYRDGSENFTSNYDTPAEYVARAALLIPGQPGASSSSSSSSSGNEAPNRHREQEQEVREAHDRAKQEYKRMELVCKQAVVAVKEAERNIAAANTRLASLKGELRKLFIQVSVLEIELGDLDAISKNTTVSLQAEEEELLSAATTLEQQITLNEAEYAELAQEKQSITSDKSSIEQQYAEAMHQCQASQIQLDNYITKNKDTHKLKDKLTYNMTEKENRYNIKLQEYNTIQQQKDTLYTYAEAETRNFSGSAGWDGTPISLRSDETKVYIQNKLQIKANKLMQSLHDINTNTNNTNTSSTSSSDNTTTNIDNSITILHQLYNTTQDSYHEMINSYNKLESSYEYVRTNITNLYTDISGNHNIHTTTKHTTTATTSNTTSTATATTSTKKRKKSNTDNNINSNNNSNTHKGHNSDQGEEKGPICQCRDCVWNRHLKKSKIVIDTQFQMYCKIREWSGKIIFEDLGNDIYGLRPLVRTDKSDAATGFKDMGQLSGGEQSFASLCLLLALGSVVSKVILVYYT